MSRPRTPGGAAMKSLGCPRPGGTRHPETLLSAGPLTAALDRAVRVGQHENEADRLRSALDEALFPLSDDVPAASAFSGDPAVAAVLRVALANAPQLRHRYQGYLDLADARLDDIVHSRLQAARRRLHRRIPAERAEFSLREGLVGFGACLLQRPGPDPMLVEVLAYLVELVLSSDGASRPGWWVHHSPLDDLSEAAEWPAGHACFTLPDGSAGIMALLALARLRGVRVPHLDSALRAVVAWHRAHQRTDERGRPHWPEAVTEPHPDPRPSAHREGNVQGPGWCGNLGIARAVQLAGLALGDPGLRRTAVAAAHAALTRDAHLFETGGICHGPHGAAFTALRIAADEGSLPLADAAAELLSAVCPDARIGDVHGGLLDGSVGERLTRPPGNPRIVLPPAGAAPWDSLLLLAPHRTPRADPRPALTRTDTRRPN
ncbi:lanthionine synthetase LanC family protein [Amycolatopsis sp. WGS_07]|uniref:lanthionine synthetase LanC family protein n=1 Tax=Amycolatopsis sp. WGS_07 TaxID=3076764 RepID=UPI0038734D5A